MENKTQIVEKKVPFALLEILVYGENKDGDKIKKMTESLQNQLAKSKKGKYARILWYIDGGEKTIDEKKEWLIEKANSRYYIFTPETYLVKPDYVKNLFVKIKKTQDAMTDFKNSGLVFSNKKPSTIETETELKLVE